MCPEPRQAQARISVQRVVVRNRSTLGSEKGIDRLPRGQTWAPPSPSDPQCPSSKPPLQRLRKRGTTSQTRAQCASKGITRRGGVDRRCRERRILLETIRPEHYGGPLRHP